MAPQPLGNTSAASSFIAHDFTNDGKYHLLLAASGSVATIKIPNIIQALSKTPHLAIRVVLTRAATEFLQGQSQEQPSLAKIARYPNVEGIHLDEHEWNPPWTRGAPILHIELRRWADLLVVAPLSATTLAKITNGICDNLLTSIIRAWQVVDTRDKASLNAINSYSHHSNLGRMQKLILVAPSMNTAMWNHPLTSQQLKLLGEGRMMHWIEVLNPVEKTIACGDTGNGAMAEWGTIVDRIKEIYDDSINT